MSKPRIDSFDKWMVSIERRLARLERAGALSSAARAARAVDDPLAEAVAELRAAVAGLEARAATSDDGVQEG